MCLYDQSRCNAFEQIMLSQDQCIPRHYLSQINTMALRGMAFSEELQCTEITTSSLKQKGEANEWKISVASLIGISQKKQSLADLLLAARLLNSIFLHEAF